MKNETKVCVGMDGHKDPGSTGKIGNHTLKSDESIELLTGGLRTAENRRLAPWSR